MARPLSWSDVRGGVIAVVALFVIGAAIMKFSRLGTLHGETFPLTALVGEARGVLVGSEVWLSGQKIGKITSISFRPPQSDTLERIEIQMEVLEQYRSAMRHDAVAQIRNGGTIIGAPVVYISAGTSAAPELRRGDTLRSKPQVDVEGATGKFDAATREFPAIIANVKVLTAQIKGTSGTAGAILNSAGAPGSPEMARTRLELARLSARLNGAKGSVSSASRGEVMKRVGGVMSRVDSLRALVASPNTSFGRFRKDSTLLNEVGKVRDELGAVRALLDSSQGTAGRAMHDTALTGAIGGVQREMGALFADMKKHPLRYIRF